MLAMLCTPSAAFALGLGEARVESFLNQPLDVRMRLLDATAEDLESLTVALADSDDFDRLGLSGRALSLGLDIEVDASVSPPVLRVTSRRAATDPVVQLLVDARWSGGRMLREYTLFLDPPTVELAPPPASAPAAEASVEPEPSPAVRPAPEPAPVPTPTSGVRAGAADRYGPVASGDTLWSIAQAHLPAGDVTMDQMMIAIVELNTAAFRDGNINRLLRGAELEMPDAERAGALDAAAAAAAVAAQNRAFRRSAAGGAAPPRVSEAGRDALASDRPEPDAGTSRGERGAEHRLSLVPPGEDEGGDATGDGGSVDALRERLARAEEELYAARQEAEEFQSRVEELERIVRDNPGSLGIRDAELAGLEETLRAAREATRDGADAETRAEVSARLGEYLDLLAGDTEGASPDGPVADAAPAVDEADDGPGAESVDEAVDEAAAERPDPQRPEAESADAERAAEPRPGPETGAEGSGGLLSGWLPIAVGAVALLIAAVVAVGLVRRRQARPADGPVETKAPEPARPAPAETDPVGAARARLAEDPSDLDRHVALLEHLETEGRESAFSDALEAMFEHVDSGSEPQWRRALRLAAGIVPGHLLVKGSADWVADDLEFRPEPDSKLDADSEVDDLMARLEAESDESGSADDDWPDFDAGPDAAEPDSQPRGGEAAEALDFDSIRAGADNAREPEPGIGFADSADAPDEAASRATDADEEVKEDADAVSPDDARESPDEGALDWPDFGFDADAPASADEQSNAPEAAAPDAPGDEDSDDSEDVFGHSDDDIDVKLDLARAYLSWDSSDSARTLLEEVLREGNEAQREQARKLLEEQGGGTGD